MSEAITSAPEVKQAVENGWELWYVASRDKLFGHWELRRRNESKRVHWEAIDKLRRNLTWWADNTEAIPQGRSWCYKLRQGQMALGLA